MYASEGKEQYYFDMKNNREHYELLTSDVTPEQFAIYEDREKLRADALHGGGKAQLEVARFVHPQREGSAAAVGERDVHARELLGRLHGADRAHRLLDAADVGAAAARAAPGVAAHAAARCTRPSGR